MFRKLALTALAVFAIAAAGAAAFAPAASAAGPKPPLRDVFLKGAGTLDAQGTGVAAVRGLVDYTANGAPNAMLLVRDVDGDASVQVDGYDGTGTFLGFTVYFNFTGTAHITATDVGVVLIGEDVSLHAVGRGWAYLRGNGTYTVNGGEPHPWLGEGGFASVSSDAR